MQALYEGHPYARKVRGTVASVEAIRRQDLVRFHQKGFEPRAITVIVVGDVDENAVVAEVGKLFADWKPSDTAAPDAKAAADVPDAVAPATRRVVAATMMNKSQADVVYGFVGIRRADPDYTAMSVMNNALGQYAIGGKLGDSIRERQGMAYYVSSSLDANVAPGPLAIRAGVSPANVDRAVASIDEEVGRLVREGLTPKELDESRRYLIGSIPRALETNAAIANFLQTEEFFGLGLDYDARLPALLGGVTLEEANETARRALDPDRATLVIAGPYDDN
jgi:zinc protease